MGRTLPRGIRCSRWDKGPPQMTIDRQTIRYEREWGCLMKIAIYIDTMSLLHNNNHNVRGEHADNNEHVMNTHLAR